MRLSKISVQNIKSKPLSAFLSILLMAFGTGIIVLLVDASKQIEGQFLNNVKGIDMVVGAKGSPLQLILSGIYHIDAPTGNISLEEFENLAKHPMVEKAIPLSYGDNYQGYRIVGTMPSYPQHYEASLKEGTWWSNSGEVVLGEKVTRLLKLKLGDHFHSSHGLGESIESHEDFEFRVVGILNSSGSVIDQLILTDLSSIWDVHGEGHGKELDIHEHNDDDGDHEHEGEGHEHGVDEEHAHDKEITVGLISFRSAMGNLMLPRMVNEKTNMQAALPAIEINRLFSIMGSGVTTIRILAFLIILISAISVFISLFQSLKERKYELVLMRIMGASSWQLVWIILFEGLIIAFLGYLLGIVFGKVGMLVIIEMIGGAYQYSLDLNLLNFELLILLPATLGLGVLAALIPSVMAYSLNMSKELSNA